MAFDITSHDRDDLVEPCEYWVKGLSDEVRNSITQSVVRVLSDWRATQRPQLVPNPLTSLPTDDAGPGASDLDLAFRLWLDDDPEFSKILDDHRFHVVFALIGLTSKSVATPRSLARLNGLLVRSLVDRLEVAEDRSETRLEAIRAKREKEDHQIKAARRIATEKKQQKATQVCQRYRQAAYSYAYDNPTANQDTILDHLQDLRLEEINKLPDRTADKQPARSTIKRYIAGIMEEARQVPRPKPSLYASDQTRKR